MRDRFGRAAQDPEGLVAYLVAVAVRAVQQVAAPPLGGAGDVGELVAQAGGDQDAPCGQRGAVLECDVEARPPRGVGPTGCGDGRDFGHQPPSVPSDLCAPAASAPWAADVGAEETLHVAAGRVARLAGVDDGDRRRARVSTSAAERPAAPPPITTTS